MKATFKSEIGQAFTLIELLIVIAIIAILAAMMLPVLSHGKAMAIRATCKSNLRQGGLVLSMYVTDFGFYPSERTGAYFTIEAIAYYLQSPDDQYGSKVFMCPTSHGMGTLEYEYNVAGSGGPSREQSLGLLDYDVNQASGLNPLSHSRHPISESRVKVPSDMIASGDIVYQVPKRLSDGQEIFADPFVRNIHPRPWIHQWHLFRHRSGANTLFCDGHVEFATRLKLEQKSDAVRRRWNNDNEPHPETWR